MLNSKLDDAKIVSVEHLSSGLKMSFLVKKLHLVCSTANIGKFWDSL